jgi:DNA-binding transcriptional regulator YdaS (Cro superfamily)
MTRRDKTRFGAAFDEALARHALRRGEAARQLSVTPAYLSKVARGGTAISPERIDAMASNLGFTERELRRLHHAAALDAGFRLDLPDDF